MSRGADLLCRKTIRRLLSAESARRLVELTVLQETDSTNAFLTRLPPARRHAHAVLADSQTGGRGRRQRSWYSPPGSNVYLSVGWGVRSGEVSWSALPLVAAVCTCRALGQLGLQGHGIKWPNDILVDGKKLAGILVESQSTGSAPPTVVIGIGLNVRMPVSRRGAESVPIDQPWIDLQAVLGTAAPPLNRNSVAACLLNELLTGLATFESSGWEAFRADWDARDLVANRRVRLEGNGAFRTGKALGVDEQGGLWVDIDGYGVQALHSAEVSLRND